MIELKHVEKSFGEVTPFNDVNAVIESGDVISVIGPSGCGKSTLLRCINMLDPPTNGEIVVDGETVTAPGYNVAKLHQKMGMVFQSFNLFGHMTALENVMIPQVDLLGRTRQEAYDRAIDLLKTVGLEERAFNYPDELSGGQKQRVAIARTLAMDPSIILFDEPTSALDPTMVGEVQAVIRKLAETGHTMMIVTHEMKFAREICNRVFYMDEGGIYEDGSPDQIFNHPLKEKTRRFINHIKTFELVTDSNGLDIPKISYKLEEYCFRSRISPKILYGLQSSFEELVTGIIVPKQQDNIQIRVSVEYSSDTGCAEMHVKTTGFPVDPEKSDNEISLMLIKAYTSEMIFEEANDGTYTSRTIMKFASEQ